jgi:hypothetical protein
LRVNIVKTPVQSGEYQSVGVIWEVIYIGDEKKEILKEKGKKSKN